MISKIANKKFWENKKIFLTGHTSFKGSWMKLWLEQLGSKIMGYSLNYPSYPNSLYKLLYKKNIKKESILNYKNLKRRISLYNPEIVFHFAAQSIVSEASKNPMLNYKTNIIGTAAVLEACAASKKVKIVVIITTDKCYEDNPNIKFYHEKSLLGGSEPYSVSKACAELISKSYYVKYKKLDKKIITLRAGNVIGGGDWKKDRLVPDIFKAILSNSKLFIRNPDSVRPWQHVLDCLNGYLIATEHSYKAKFTYNTWNFAPPIKNQIKVLKFVKNILYKFNFDHKNIFLENNKNFHESKRLNLISNKAKRELNWNTILSEKNVINFISEWYLGFLNKKNIKKISIKQIKDFYKIAKGAKK